MHILSEGWSCPTMLNDDEAEFLFGSSRLVQFEVIWDSRHVLENGRERAQEPASYLVRAPALDDNFWQVQQRFVAFPSLAWGRRLRLRERLLIIACRCRLLLVACGRCPRSDLSRRQFLGGPTKVRRLSFSGLWPKTAPPRAPAHMRYSY